MVSRQCDKNYLKGVHYKELELESNIHLDHGINLAGMHVYPPLFFSPGLIWGLAFVCGDHYSVFIS